MNPKQVLLVITTLPDEESARTLAQKLVNTRLAACVNIQSPCTSVYRWQGAVEEAQEIPLHIKTTAAVYPILEAALKAAHPYELPEIIALPVSEGLPDYLAWVMAEANPTHTGV